MSAGSIIGLAVLAAMAVAAWIHRDTIRALFDRIYRKAEPQPAAPTIVAPVKPLSTIDYKHWGGYTPYELQMMVGRVDGPFPRGIPPEWDWQEWARVNGKADPTSVPTTGPAVSRDTFVLNQENGWLVRPEVVMGVTHTFHVEPGSGKTRIRVYDMGEQLKVVNGLEVGAARERFFPMADTIDLNVDGIGRTPGRMRLVVQAV